jgi:hypothetical protein
VAAATEVIAITVAVLNRSCLKFVGGLEVDSPAVMDLPLHPKVAIYMRMNSKLVGVALALVVEDVVAVVLPLLKDAAFLMTSSKPAVDLVVEVALAAMVIVVHPPHLPLKHVTLLKSNLKFVDALAGGEALATVIADLLLLRQKVVALIKKSSRFAGGLVAEEVLDMVVVVHHQHLLQKVARLTKNLKCVVALVVGEV